MCVSVRALSSSDGKSISSPQAPVQVLFTLAVSFFPQPEKAIDSCVTVSSGATMVPPLHAVFNTAHVWTFTLWLQFPSRCSTDSDKERKMV